MIDLERAMPGYTSTEFPDPDPDTADWSIEQWETEFEKTGSQLRDFLLARDPFVILARTAARYIIEFDLKDKVGRLEQPEVEIVQALLLLNGANYRFVPTSPDNFIRFWPLIGRNIRAFIRKQKDTQLGVAAFVARRARNQTIYYRNIFTRAECERALLDILTRVDAESESALGYRLSELFRAMMRVTDIVLGRLEEFSTQIVKLMRANSREEMLPAIDFFRSAYPLADKAWCDRASSIIDLKQFRYAAFQMSELAYPWVFTIGRDQLSAEFPSRIIDGLYQLSLRPGDLSDTNPQHIYLDNPIWKRPYIRQGDGLFVAIPQLVFSFPFAIVEGLIDKHQELEQAYEAARAVYLEDAVIEAIHHAMPSANVYQGIIWSDPKTGQIWENDVVAVVGNFVFVFEAKSGRIKDAARRGANLSLAKNFKELFVAPGLQGWRLQNYLDRNRASAALRRKSDGSLIDIGLDRPKVVFRFSVCIEHFASLTSAKHYLKELGLVTNETAWAPVLSLGELQMISRYLDSEASFVHYLTRRATLEELIDFEGDEQDLLSLYLTNGLCLDPSALDGRRVMFHNADGMVRQNKVPRTNRRKFEAHGIQLSPLWAGIVEELYLDCVQRHRFDINGVILNQLPPALFDFERRIRRFRRGVSHGGEDLLITRFVVGKKVFVLAIYLAKTMPDSEEWRSKGHAIVEMFHHEKEAVDCAAFIFLRRSKELTFDGVSFYRSGLRSEPSDALQ